MQLPDALMQSTAWHVLLDALSITYALLRTGTLHSIGYTASADGVEWHTLLYQNALTLLNTDLLLFSGAVSIAAVHSHAMLLPTAAAVQLVGIVLLACMFLTVQCCEYLHLY